MIDREQRCAQRNGGGLLMFPQTPALLRQLVYFHRICLFMGTEPLYRTLAMAR